LPLSRSRRRGGLGIRDDLPLAGPDLLPAVELDQVALGEHVADRVRRLGADTDPVLGPLFVEVHLLGGILLERVVPADLLDGGAVAAGAAVEDLDAVEGPVLAAGAGHADSNHWQSPKRPGPPPGIGRQV